MFPVELEQLFLRDRTRPPPLTYIVIADIDQSILQQIFDDIHDVCRLT